MSAAPPVRCFKCGQPGHISPACPSRATVCFNCNEHGHIAARCPKPKKERSDGVLGAHSGRPRATGRVFALNSAEASSSPELIQGKGFIHQSPVVVLFDSGATNSFVSLSCVRKLNLPVSPMKTDLLVSTRGVHGSVWTSFEWKMHPIQKF